MTEKTLYAWLGGVFAIAAVLDHFSDAVVQNGAWGRLRKRSAQAVTHMRTLWVCAAAGGSFPYTPTKAGKTQLGLKEAHRDLRISPDEFDEAAAEPPSISSKCLSARKKKSSPQHTRTR